jgi:hypothetical protein
MKSSHMTVDNSRRCEFHNKVHPNSWFETGQSTCRRGVKQRAKGLAEAEANSARHSEWLELVALVGAGQYRIAGRDAGYPHRGDGPVVTSLAVGDLARIGFYYPGGRDRVEVWVRAVEVTSVDGTELKGRLLPDIFGQRPGTLFYHDVGAREGSEVSFPAERVRGWDAAGAWRVCPKCGTGLSTTWAVCYCGNSSGGQCPESYSYTGDWPGQEKSAQCCLVEGHSGPHDGWSS